MNSVTDHYERLLAPIYLWMSGGPTRDPYAGTLGSFRYEAIRIAFTSVFWRKRKLACSCMTSCMSDRAALGSRV